MKTYEKIYNLLKEEKDWVSGERLSQQLGLSRTSIWKGIQRLEKEGVSIDSVKKKGYRIASGDLLIPQQLSQELGIPVSLKTDSQSTQTDAKTDYLTDDKHLYLAPSQAAAVGRFGRPFFAPKQGGIYLSYRFRPFCPLEDLPNYTLLAAASVVLAIKALTGKNPQIKWVNDIYLDGKKIAGILTESQLDMETGLVGQVIIGMGLNFHITDFPKEIADKAGSLFTQTPPISRQDLIAKIGHIFKETPEAVLLDTYQSHSLVIGKTVSFTQNGQSYQGLASSIDQAGILTVQLDNGESMALNSGEISLSDW
ncbi:bifunctional biotin--[acetyl-CoA-carboxylase] ligase/biotin operon repressor BirA [Streptococcus sp. DD12]|uniref:bifunctional biotin--[acetyl-CoA-carboxylase] ligase/biotin operon repressor BirA n=1 Tax=Streptococcus sp. DD12 TaxID=1777880 RepID=UPI00079BE4E7|nr:bifunctional biotin--[acetyl-CoA-carboxylase] ligase/biotin operon repressor BirA [Streptococcus sp. DD12]KXT75775.1 Biotin-protein ligase / Biotin operon repressor [Streptococcus sp. DD12]